MSVVRSWWVFLACLFLLTALELHAQDNRLLPAGDWAYDMISRLQRRGHLLELNPTSLPYRQGEIWEALVRMDTTELGRTEKHWVKMLRRSLAPVQREDGEVALGMVFEFGTRFVNTRRLDVLRPLGDSLHLFPYTRPVVVYADAGPVVAELGLWQDRYYDKDPDGLDTALRLWTRSEHTYAGYHSRLFSVYLGRWDNHWSVPGEAATLLSNNARSQDQIVFRLGGQRLSMQALLRELDSVTDDGRFTGRVADDTVRVGNQRRYLAAHRLDFRPSRHFMISLMESVVYSGSNVGISLKYLNPFHPAFIVVDNRPKNEENNAMMAGLLWAQYKRLTLHGQLLVDDINLSSGRGNETITYSFAGSAVATFRAMDIGITLVAVTSRAYNAPQPGGKYLYLRRGLATQFSDYVHASFFADFYLDDMTPGLRLTPRLDWLLQGERDIRQSFPSNEAVLDNILDGTVVRTVRPALQAAYQPSSWWWVRLDVGLNTTTNADHVSGIRNSRVVGLLEAGLRLKLDKAIRLSFP